MEETLRVFEVTIKDGVKKKEVTIKVIAENFKSALEIVYKLRDTYPALSERSLP